MPCYSIVVTRDVMVSITEECLVEVEAPDEDTARRLAPEETFEQGEWIEADRVIHDQTAMVVGSVHDLTVAEAVADMLRQSLEGAGLRFVQEG